MAFKNLLKALKQLFQGLSKAKPKLTFEVGHIGLGLSEATLTALKGLSRKQSSSRRFQGIPRSPGKSQKKSQEGYGEVKELGGLPQLF